MVKCSREMDHSNKGAQMHCIFHYKFDCQWPRLACSTSNKLLVIRLCLPVCFIFQYTSISILLGWRKGEFCTNTRWEKFILVHINTMLLM